MYCDLPNDCIYMQHLLRCSDFRPVIKAIKPGGSAHYHRAIVIRAYDNAMSIQTDVRVAINASGTYWHVRKQMLNSWHLYEGGMDAGLLYEMSQEGWDQRGQGDQDEERPAGDTGVMP